MNLVSLTLAHFKEIVRLLEEKEALQAQLDLVNQKLGSFNDVAASAPTQAAVDSPAASASATNVPPAGKGKRSPEARAKMAEAQRARWAKERGGVAATPSVATRTAATSEAPKPKSTAKPVRKAGSKATGTRGETKEKIIAVLKAAGKAGITVGEVATKLGAKYNNTYVWFATTGRKVQEIKKVGKALYCWVG